jgi:hypothetical protein
VHRDFLINLYISFVHVVGLHQQLVQRIYDKTIAGGSGRGNTFYRSVSIMKRNVHLENILNLVVCEISLFYTGRYPAKTDEEKSSDGRSASRKRQEERSVTLRQPDGTRIGRPDIPFENDQGEEDVQNSRETRKAIFSPQLYLSSLFVFCCQVE